MASTAAFPPASVVNEFASSNPTTRPMGSAPGTLPRFEVAPPRYAAAQRSAVATTQPHWALLMVLTEWEALMRTRISAQPPTKDPNATRT